MTWLGLALAGGLGAVCRFLLDALVRRRWDAPIPVATLLINVLGSFSLGVLVGWVGDVAGAADLRTIVGTGFLGGFTTFSTAAVEVALLGRERRWLAGIVLGLGMLGLGLAAAAGGLALGHAL